MSSEQQQGTVKWFNNKDGYGFITDENNVDHYFNVKNIIGADLPQNGHKVEFVAKQGKKGPAAVDVKLGSAPEKARSKRQDDRISCPGCDKKIVPRIVFDHGRATHSVCPFCATTVKQFSSDFVIWIVIGILMLAFLFMVS